MNLESRCTEAFIIYPWILWVYRSIVLVFSHKSLYLSFFVLESESEVAQLCLTFCSSMDCSAPSMGFSRQEYWSGLPFPFSRRSS